MTSKKKRQVWKQAWFWQMIVLIFVSQRLSYRIEHFSSLSPELHYFLSGVFSQCFIFFCLLPLWLVPSLRQRRKNLSLMSRADRIKRLRKSVKRHRLMWRAIVIVWLIQFIPNRLYNQFYMKLQIVLYYHDAWRPYALLFYLLLLALLTGCGLCLWSGISRLVSKKKRRNF